MKNTTLCYIECGGSYLMLHRVKKKNDENHDKWIGIGGHFEENESPFDCMIREIREETSIDVPPEKLSYRGIVTFISASFESQQMHLFNLRVVVQQRKGLRALDGLQRLLRIFLCIHRISLLPV